MLQSPIDLGSAVERDTEGLAIRYVESVIQGQDTGTTLEFPVADGGSLTYGGRQYELKEFHFHTPSEHVVDREYRAAEIHFVNEDTAGDFAIVAVFAQESDEAQGPYRLEEPLSLKDLLPESLEHYAYEGSLTTHPFTEGVQWIVLTDPIVLHPDWIQAFRDKYGPNNRDLQALGDRTVTLG